MVVIEGGRSLAGGRPLVAPLALYFILPLLAAGASLRAASTQSAATKDNRNAANATEHEVPVHPDAVTMKSWVFLKDSMTQIRGEVQRLLSVKDDVMEMRKDLLTQEEVWHQAEADFKHDNLQLALQVETLRRQVNAGQSTWSTVEAMRKELADAKRHNEQLQLEADQERKRIGLEQTFYSQRRDNLSKLVSNITTGVQRQVLQAHDRQLQLETDGVALRLKANELTQRLTTGNEELHKKKVEATAEIANVQRQLQGMRDGLMRLHEALNNSGSIEMQKAEMAKVEIELQKEVALMVSVQQEQTNTITECKRLQTVRQDAMCAEQRKAEMRKREAKELCDPVRGQMVALQQMLQECRFNASRLAASANSIPVAAPGSAPAPAAAVYYGIPA